MVLQRHLALVALDQLQLAGCGCVEPVQELEGVAHRGRQQQRADVLRQQPQRQFPDDAALEIGEAVELVHHHGADLAEIEGRAGDGGRGVGWVERSEPHHALRRVLVGLAADPPYRSAGVQQAVKQDLGDDDQHAGVGIFAAIAGHQARRRSGGSPSGRPPICISRNFCSVRAISGVV